MRALEKRSKEFLLLSFCLVAFDLSTEEVRRAATDNVKPGFTGWSAEVH